jgi:gamma-glutamyltranspeptidase
LPATRTRLSRCDRSLYGPPSLSVARGRALDERDAASPHPLPTAPGVDVLRRGGNAVDAANRHERRAGSGQSGHCGLGGDGIWLVHEPRTGETVAYDGSGRASAALDANASRVRGGDGCGRDRKKPAAGGWGLTPRRSYWDSSPPSWLAIHR